MEDIAGCALCVRLVNRRQDVRWVTDLPSGSLFFSDFHMRWLGSLMLVNSRHVVEQTELEEDMRWQLFRDRDRVERAIMQVLQPARLNLAKFGNVCEHLHWHFIPRYGGEVFARLSPWEITEADPKALFTQERLHWKEDELHFALRHVLES